MAGGPVANIVNFAQSGASDVVALADPTRPVGEGLGQSAYIPSIVFDS